VTENSLHLRLPPETASVTTLLDALEAYTEARELPIKLASRLMLVADELTANVVMHSAGASFLQADVVHEGDLVRFILTDDGPEFDPLGRGVPNTNGGVEEREVGGLGMHFVERLAAQASYRREDDRNILTITLDARAD